MDSEEKPKCQDWWDNLSENQQRHINEGLIDAKHGRIVSSKDFWEILKNNAEDISLSPGPQIIN